MVDFNGFDGSKIFDELNDAVVVFNESKIIFSNASGRSSFGSARWTDIFFPDQLQRQLMLFFQAAELKENQFYPLQYNQNNKLVTFKWKFVDLTSEKNGRLCLAIGAQQESRPGEEDKNNLLSEKHLFRDAPSEIDRYRVLAANIPYTNIFLIDKKLNYIMAEGPNFKHWGLDKSYFEGKSLREVHTTNFEDIGPLVIRALRRKQTMAKEFSYINRVYTIMAKPILSGGEVEYILGIVRDISDEHRIRKDLEKSERKYRTLVEESTEIIFSINNQLEVTYISPNIKQFLGFEPYELISGGFISLLHPDDKQAFVENGGEGDGFFANYPYVEFRLRHFKGEYKVFGVNGKVIYDEQGKFRYYTGIARDISQIKAAKKELYLSKERAEQALAAKSQFLSVMSHEIRTPMNAVIGMSHLLIEGNPREDQLENLRTLQFSAENLLQLINNILDFSKMGSGKIELEKVPFNIETVLQRIIHSCSYQLREKNLEMVVNIDPSIPTYVLGDPVRLSQIINNLLSNAIKFTEEGRVRIGLTVLAQKKKQVTVCFEFEDTGIGIPEDKRDTIFEAFTQASITTTRKYGGTGLGLAIVKKLIELFDSRISVESKPEGGTVFQFDITFAKVKKRDGRGEEKSRELARDLGNVKILVAEDNLVNQVMLKKFLQNWEVGELVFASNGEEAIHRYMETDFDLLLLDLQMPLKDGFEVARYIRNLPDGRKNKIPIIALTASAFEEVKDRLKQVKINDFISKPFTPDELLNKLIKHLDYPLLR